MSDESARVPQAQFSTPPSESVLREKGGSGLGRLKLTLSPATEGALRRRKMLEHVIDVFLKLLNVLVGVG
jgi:hypothetical protein